MDAWAALWFWPLTDTDGVTPPTLDQWIEACQKLLGREPEARKKNRGMTNLASAASWDDLNDAEELNLDFAGAVAMEQVLKSHPWLEVCRDVAEQQGFFHWELDFATVFARGGFDLQLGNPPWVRPRYRRCDEGTWWHYSPGGRPDGWRVLALKPSEAARKAKREATLALPGIRDLVISATPTLWSRPSISAQRRPILSWPDCSRISTGVSWSRHGRTLRQEES